MGAHSEFDKIKVMNPVVELDGDEMTRILWQMIKEKLIFPFLDMDIDYYDLSITYRDETEDQVTVAAAAAIQRHNVGIKCATIMPDKERIMEFGIMNVLDDPNGILHAAVNGTEFQVPIIIRNVPRCVPGWAKPIIIGRNKHIDQSRCAAVQFDQGARIDLFLNPKVVKVQR